MSGTTDLLQEAQVLTGVLAAGQPPGRLSANFVGTSLTVTGPTGPQNTYDVTAEGIYGGSPSSFRNTPAYQFSNARDVGGVTLIDLQTVNRLGSLSGVVTYELVAVDAHHALLFQPASSSYIILADDNSLNPNAPGAAFPAPNQTGDLMLSQVSGGPYSCFAAGTSIRMASGDALVETITPGDVVMTPNGPREVVATLSRRIRFNRQADAELALPIRISAASFGPSIPSRDLVVSPDHAIMIDGVLIAARRLVNGSSITVERSMPSVRYVHIELAEHGVIFAEDLATESYLDCGKRVELDTGFDVVSVVPTIETTAAAYADRGCAPLATDAETVRPVWERLSARAGERGLAVAAVPTTNDANLQVIAGSVALTRVSTNGADHSFALPAGLSSVRIASRFARPTDAQPWLDDRRKLGVAISKVVVGAEDIALDDAAGDGWHAAEAGFRWTNGDAILTVTTSAETRVLTLTVAGTITYAVPALELARAA